MGYQNGYKASDEGLPEVVENHAPQALTDAEAQDRAYEHDQRDKYHVVFDSAPKYPDHGAYYAQDAPHSVTIMSPQGSTVPWESLAAGDGSMSGRDNHSEKHEERLICGLRRKIFFLALIAALVVIAAAIGGGVGGGVAAARSREGSGPAAAAATSSSSSSTLPAATSSDPAATATLPSTSSTTSSVPAPTATFLNNMTEPMGFAFQGFSGANYTGNATRLYREEGFYDLEFGCMSYVWLPNTTHCCVTFCADQHNATGYRCQARKREQASSIVPRIYIWCDPNGQMINLNGTCS